MVLKSDDFKIIDIETLVYIIQFISCIVASSTRVHHFKDSNGFNRPFHCYLRKKETVCKLLVNNTAELIGIILK